MGINNYKEFTTDDNDSLIRINTDRLIWAVVKEYKNSDFVSDFIIPNKPIGKRGWYIHVYFENDIKWMPPDTRGNLKLYYKDKHNCMDVFNYILDNFYFIEKPNNFHNIGEKWLLNTKYVTTIYCYKCKEKFNVEFYVCGYAYLEIFENKNEALNFIDCLIKGKEKY